MMFRKPVLLPVSDNEVPNLVDPLNGEIHSHWGLFQSFRRRLKKGGGEEGGRRGGEGDWVSEWIPKYFHLTCDMRNVKQSIALDWF